MNYEIELKAHVYDRAKVIECLNKEAEYLGHTEKADDYYHFALPENHKAPDGRDFLSARIRKEKLTLNGKTSSTCYFTYKRKETHKEKDGKNMEVNEENEFTFDDAAPLKIFFKDLNASIDLHKEKSVEQWQFKIDGESAHCELCTVPPLGDFLEIEIIKNQNDSQTVEKCRKAIINIFKICGLSENDIEERYYRDMLKEARV